MKKIVTFLSLFILSFFHGYSQEIILDQVKFEVLAHDYIELKIHNRHLQRPSRNIRVSLEIPQAESFYMLPTSPSDLSYDYEINKNKITINISAPLAPNKQVTFGIATKYNCPVYNNPDVKFIQVNINVQVGSQRRLHNFRLSNYLPRLEYKGIEVSSPFDIKLSEENKRVEILPGSYFFRRYHFVNPSTTHNYRGRLFFNNKAGANTIIQISQLELTDANGNSLVPSMNSILEIEKSNISIPDNKELQYQIRFINLPPGAKLAILEQVRLERCSNGLEPESFVSMFWSADSNCTTNETNRSFVQSPNPLKLTQEEVTICSGDAVNLAVTGGTGYEWEPKTGLSDPFSSNPIATATSTTLYKVYDRDPDGCGHFKQVLVKVNPKPEINILPSSYLEMCATGFRNIILQLPSDFDPINNPRYSYTVYGLRGVNVSTKSLQNNIHNMQLNWGIPNAPEFIQGGFSIIDSRTGCTNIKPLGIRKIEPPKVEFYDRDVTTVSGCLGQPLTIIANGHHSWGNISWIGPNIMTQQQNSVEVRAYQGDRYTFRAEAGHPYPEGCTVQKDITINVFKRRPIYYDRDFLGRATRLWTENIDRIYESSTGSISSTRWYVRKIGLANTFIPFYPCDNKLECFIHPDTGIDAIWELEVTYRDNGGSCTDQRSRIVLPRRPFREGQNENLEPESKDDVSQSINIYPVPAIDKLHIEVQNDNLDYSFQMIDLMGNVVKSGSLNGTQNELSVQELSNGFYFLQLLDEDGNMYREKVEIRK